MDTNIHNCIYHLFTLHNVEIRNLDNNIKILLSPYENKIIKICNQERDPLIVKGTYLIRNINNCIFSINDKIIRNFKTELNTEIKFIDYQEKHNQITTLNLSEPSLLNISREVSQQRKLVESIQFSPNNFETKSYILYILIALIIVLLIFRFYKCFCARLHFQRSPAAPKEIPLQDLSAHF